ncbi:MAG: tetratricopeptide repeat protein [Bacteroidetes bacterium]|nr:MAG: tetratricopeptide repeat protein [Bacteroidota bacterium]
MKRLSLFFILIILGLQGFSQNVNPEVRRGNREFKSENFRDAELNYRQALEQNPQSIKALYNLANALYKQNRYEEAANILDGISKLELPDNRRADVYHNLGNSRLGNQQIKESIEAYKNSLRIRPEDNETRHNLALAMQLLQEQEQDQDGEQNQDQQDDQQQQPDQDDQDQPDDEQQQQPQPRPDQISPEDAQRILDALNQQEQEIQEKIDREDTQSRPQRPLREW